MKKFTKQEILELYGQVTLGEISFSQMVEIMNKRVSEAENLCIEDIPKRKFKKGDKVRIKEGVSSKTHCYFPTPLDDFIGKTMTVGWYTYHEAGYVVCDESGFLIREDWLEPYEGLKKGDLAIFWQFDKTQATIRLLDNEQGDVFQTPIYVDNTGHWWANAIKFESIEQYERLIRGEI